MKGSSPVVELKLPVLPDMELSATKTAEGTCTAVEATIPVLLRKYLLSII